MDSTPPLSVCELVRSDLRQQEVSHKGVLWTFLYLFTIPGFLAVFLYRLSACCRQKQGAWRHAAMLLWRLNILLNSCDIAPDAVIGSGFYLPHPMGVVIGQTVIGKNAVILQNVTIGKHHTQALGLSAYPVFGDDVVLSAGSVILGSIHIGDKAIVGANAVVLKDVPPGYVAVGVPARILAPKGTLV